MRDMFSFIAFLSTFVILYGLLNFYFYRKVSLCVPLDSWVRTLLAVFLVLMVFAPFLVNLSAKAGLRDLAVVSAYVGYIWMGAVFIFFCTHLVFDAAFVSRWILLKITGGAPSAVFDKRAAVLGVVVMMVSAAVLWGWFEARNIRIEKIRVTSEKIPSSHPTVRIVQVSDMHFGVILGEAFARKVAGLLSEIGPDILVSTGDMIDRGLPDPDSVARVLRSVPSPMGKFAVAGNHEFYAGIDDAAGFHEKAGFVFLRNEAVPVSEHLAIAGIDDPAGKRYGLDWGVTRKKLLESLSPEHFTILLKHQPVPAGGARYGIDLQLSGHTHMGQIFPFTIVVNRVYPHRSGFHRLEDGSIMYVNRGTGFWGPPIRFLAPPEITVIDIEPG